MLARCCNMMIRELEKHIGIQITDVAQCLEELSELYNYEKLKGTIKVEDIDNSIISIDGMIQRIDAFAKMARDIERNFKYV